SRASCGGIAVRQEPIHLTNYRLRIALNCPFQNDQGRGLLTGARRECELAGRGGMLRKAQERLRAETMQVQSYGAFIFTVTSYDGRTSHKHIGVHGPSTPA